MRKFYSIYQYDGRTPTIHPKDKADWDITARAASAKVEVARLGVQTNPNRVIRETHRMAMCWSPRWARSYTILALVHSDYYGLPENAPTGYAHFSVIYYSRSNEGRFLVTEHKPSWNNFRIVSTLDRNTNLNLYPAE